MSTLSLTPLCIKAPVDAQQVLVTTPPATPSAPPCSPIPWSTLHMRRVVYDTFSAALTGRAQHLVDLQVVHGDSLECKFGMLGRLDILSIYHDAPADAFIISYFPFADMDAPAAPSGGRCYQVIGGPAATLGNLLVTFYGPPAGMEASDAPTGSAAGLPCKTHAKLATTFGQILTAEWKFTQRIDIWGSVHVMLPEFPPKPAHKYTYKIPSHIPVMPIISSTLTSAAAVAPRIPSPPSVPLVDAV